jgi:hypothetical protein
MREEFDKVLIVELLFSVLIKVEEESPDDILDGYGGDLFKLDSSKEVSEYPFLGLEFPLKEDSVHHLDAHHGLVVGVFGSSDLMRAEGLKYIGHGLLALFIESVINDDFLLTRLVCMQGAHGWVPKQILTR